MGMIVTSFLANVFILQAVSEETVKVSYTTPMQMFLVVNITLIVLALIEYLFILHGKEKTSQTTTILNTACSPEEPHKTFKLDQSASDNEIQSTGNGKEEHVRLHEMQKVHVVDKMSRILFPLTYIVFFAVYFGYYTYAS
ncbi:uncharacterized protein LOC130648762 [Hydractinia symbiolongicarpus]|uniref:uncharacterized protein LOC130648762 n=1 Tax=Hydractinia symbiolongicarpus TaxID=13093 RepID=UPI00255022CD|nr:uncharacterized protein LOC130648762 [Hydractinia symbiolongicarpus]